MKCIILFIIMIFSFSIYAKINKEIKVSFRLKKYDLTFGDEKIIIKDKLVLLSIDKKKCNENIYNEFYFLILQNYKTLKFSEQSQNYKVDFNKMLIFDEKKSAIISKNNSSFQFFENIVDEIKNFKIKETVLCT